MRTVAFFVMLITGIILAVVVAFGILGMIYLIATNGDGAGMAGATLLFGVIGLFAWAYNRYVNDR